MALKTSFGGGDFFKGKDYTDAFAVLIEPRGSREHQGNFGPDTYTDADITVFPSVGHLDGKEDPIVLTNVTIGGGVLARDMADNIGDQCFGKLVEKPSKKGRPFVCLEGINDIALVNAAAKYLEQRDAKRAEAHSAALADAPDFLK